MKKVGLLFGSRASEHEVSIDSAASVLENFPHDKYDVVPIYIAKDDKWYVGDFTAQDLRERKFHLGKRVYLTMENGSQSLYNRLQDEFITIDVAFIMLHGPMGEGGLIQGLLESANIPYTGCKALSSGLCMDKIYTHIIASNAGIPMAKYQVVTPETDYKNLEIEYPCIVKPAREGSSFGVHYVKEANQLEEALLDSLSYDSKVLIEEYIKGTEVGIGILDTPKGRIISEMDQVNIDGEVFDFQTKYHPHNTETLPQTLFSENVQDTVKRYANQIFDVMECSGFARLDFFVDANENIYFNEVNTIPGFTKTSRFPNMMARMGIPYTDVIDILIQEAGL